MIMEEDPLDDGSAKTNNNFMSISPMIRETLEQRRAKEIRDGNHMSVGILAPEMIDYHKSKLMPSH